MWVVDTCIILDVFTGDPLFGVRSASLLEELAGDGLAISPVTAVELGAAFRGNLKEQNYFLANLGISHTEAWASPDVAASHAAWNSYVTARRTERIQKRPIADLLIGGFASNRRGLITRNARDFRRWFPSLKIQTP